jgi:hypothetical protein
MPTRPLASIFLTSILERIALSECHRQRTCKLCPHDGQAIVVRHLSACPLEPELWLMQRVGVADNAISIICPGRTQADGHTLTL